MGPKMAAKTQPNWKLSYRSGKVAFYISWQTNPCRSQIILLISLFDRGHSSVGRALAWHARGRGFESHWLHSRFSYNSSIASWQELSRQ